MNNLKIMERCGFFIWPLRFTAHYALAFAAGSAPYLVAPAHPGVFLLSATVFCLSLTLTMLLHIVISMIAPFVTGRYLEVAAEVQREQLEAERLEQDARRGALSYHDDYWG